MGGGCCVGVAQTRGVGPIEKGVWFKLVLGRGRGLVSSGRGLTCPHPQAAPGADTPWAGGEEPSADFSGFYQSEEPFPGPGPALYGPAYLKGASAPPPAPALPGPAPAKADGPAPGECWTRTRRGSAPFSP